ncbi:hypothetical protein ACIPIA_05180, partial [Bosea sp. CER48]
MKCGFAVRFGMAALLGVAAAPGARAAGLFDGLARAIFGQPRLYAPPIYEYDDERPRARPRPRAPDAAPKPKAPIVKLDPQTDRNWHLKDPTLRRGDIVVTASGVLVYQGRDSDATTPADFVALGGSDPKGWKQNLQTAAAGGRTMLQTPQRRA